MLKSRFTYNFISPDMVLDRAVFVLVLPLQELTKINFVEDFSVTKYISI